MHHILINNSDSISICEKTAYIYADNGTEFSNPTAIECDDDGVIRSYVIYCDPSSPNQKRSKDNKDFCVSRNYLLTKHIKRPESYAVG